MPVSYGPTSVPEERPLWKAMGRGLRCRCPNCKQGKLFSSFLKVADRCEVCGEDFHHHRADDLPAYLVIFIVGHIVVAGFMGVEAAVALTTWQHLAVWVPVTIVSSILLLQPIKGSVVGLQWALRMHGFGGHEDEIEDHPER